MLILPLFALLGARAQQCSDNLIRPLATGFQTDVDAPIFAGPYGSPTQCAQPDKWWNKWNPSSGWDMSRPNNMFCEGHSFMSQAPFNYPGPTCDFLQFKAGNMQDFVLVDLGEQMDITGLTFTAFWGTTNNPTPAYNGNRIQNQIQVWGFDSCEPVRQPPSCRDGQPPKYTAGISLLADHGCYSLSQVPFANAGSMGNFRTTVRNAGGKLLSTSWQYAGQNGLRGRTITLPPTGGATITQTFGANDGWCRDLSLIHI